jgi:hypothetical protein
MKLVTGILGMKLYNSAGQNNILHTNSWMNIGDVKIWHNVSLEENNTL